MAPVMTGQYTGASFTMQELDNLKKLSKQPANETLLGLTSMFKVFAKDGSFAFVALSDLDLDTDGQKDPNIRYESTHQSQTSVDPQGEWLNSNTLNFIVLPGGFSARHGNTCPMRTLATVAYNGHIAHCIVADIGPKSKFGEGSIALHRALGFERVKNEKIVDCGIDSGVTTVIYANTSISTPCNQSDIDKACKPYWDKFTAS